MPRAAHQDTSAAIRHGLAVLVARLDGVHPLMLAPAVLLLVLIVMAFAVVVVAVVAAAVVVAVGTGFTVCLRRVLAAAVAYEGPRKEVHP
jgi:hypothetical protein